MARMPVRQAVARRPGSTAMGHGRPSRYSDELFAEITWRIAQGEPLTTICQDDHMPGVGTVNAWLRADEELSDAYERARAIGYDHLAESLLHVASGHEDHSTGDTQRDKLVVDTTLRLLKCWDPKRYNENAVVQVRHADADGGKLDTAPQVNELLTLLRAQAAPSSPGD